MIVNDKVLKYGEKTVFTLRSLFSGYGYSQYKMSKFEEYDLYVRNKDFLISEGVITFTDTNGRLMALKPDVTLSIIKNSNDNPGFVQKFYYDENVYRVSDKTHTFKEIMQVGLECIGDIDDYCIEEVVALSAKSLMLMGKEAVLDISHLGILSDVFAWAGIPEEDRATVMKYVGEKNLHELHRFCEFLGVEDEKTAVIKKLVGTYGKPKEVLPKLREMLGGIVELSSVDTLSKIVDSIEMDEGRDIIRIDFSVISDIKYYNGIVFKGFLSGIPQSVLSGGQYDRLMKKMQKKSGAIGFAVYLDLLERLHAPDEKYDADTVILYDKNSDNGKIREAVKKYSEEGSVSVQRKLPEKFRYKKIVKIMNGEVTVLE
ncbi:MAG: ATP phosphoribosyltransferase regulatory subunit [Clostridia bacterium]|nr:ATP phosphoribosyltransferase regulatory subunit [Clostridia bacterium]